MSDTIKNTIRLTMQHEREQKELAFRSSSSHQICTRICTLDIYKNAGHIALYQPIKGEVDLTELWHQATADKKTCYFPVLNPNQTLSFLPATPETPFKNNKLHIPEPDVRKESSLPVNELDLILLPLVAFDIRCTRLGMGAGYYDRTLEDAGHPTLVGVAYQFQRVDFIEPNPWDIPLDAVVTQRAIYWNSR